MMGPPAMGLGRNHGEHHAHGARGAANQTEHREARSQECLQRDENQATEEEGDLELSTEIDKQRVVFHLGADCFYRVIKKALGNPRRMVISPKKKEKKKDNRIVN